MEKPRKFNQAKRVILSVMANRGWLSTRLVQQLAGFRYALNDRLLKYARWGLIERAPGKTRPAMWRITPQGVRRLNWLRRNG